MEHLADLIGIHASAVERVIKVQEVILRAIDGRVKWDTGHRKPGDFGRLRSVHSTDSTNQFEMRMECTPGVFNNSIRKAEKIACPWETAGVVPPSAPS